MSPPTYDKATSKSISFVALFESVIRNFRPADAINQHSCDINAICRKMK
jgi:hypothetical protein